MMTLFTLFLNKALLIIIRKTEQLDLFNIGYIKGDHLLSYMHINLYINYSDLLQQSF